MESAGHTVVSIKFNVPLYEYFLFLVESIITGVLKWGEKS
jgi:hypothetical protein